MCVYQEHNRDKKFSPVRTLRRWFISTQNKVRNETNKTVQFKLEDRFFPLQDAKGHLSQLPRNALDKEIVSADGAALELNNLKNGYKGVCVYQEHNGDENFIPVRTLRRWFISNRNKVNNKIHTCQCIEWEAKIKISMLRT